MSFLNRRQFLGAAALLPTAAFSRQIPVDARLIANVPLGDPGGRNAPPFHTLLGAGLDARLFTDLSGLSADKPETLITSNDRFYVRTAPSLGHASPPIFGGASGAATLDGVVLSRMERVRVGPWLMECAGNSDPTNFGLMSAAAWTGFPMAAILEQLGTDARRPRVLVEGADPEGPSATSIPGASWIFSRDHLARAMLAGQMNDAPLPADHGFPLRLVVPGWYGCACIKWVNRIELVPDEAPATTQMREFAARTHQSGTPTLARDFTPAVVDAAAMPVRVEKWAADGRVFYRVIGIVWGGSKPTNALSIRFKSGEPWTRVDDCRLPASALTWSLWSHTWRPEAPGRYEIVLRVDDPSIRTRRLDLFFYVREVVIDEV